MDRKEFLQSFDFTGRTAVVTGGAGVLCGEISCMLAALGARVAILDLMPERAGKWRSRLEELRCEHLVLPCDVLKRESVDAAITQVLARWESIDFLINGAGGNKPGATTSSDLSFFDLPDEALRFVFDLNLLGTIIPSQVVGRHMAEQSRGVVLNISSMNALRPLTRIPAYSSAKAGVSNFTQWMAVHMAQNYSPEIRVNAIAPGFFMTAQNRFLLVDEKSGQLTERGRSIIAHTPAGRFGVPQDLLGAVVWLLSPASAFVTGTVLPVDGGFQAYSGV
ncbi:MAG: SDR family oxidoreductase [Acidobacteriota bacterium]